MNKYFCNNFKFFFYVFLIFNTRFFSIFFKFFNLETNFWAFFVQVYEVLSRFLSLSFHFNTAIIDNFVVFSSINSVKRLSAYFHLSWQLISLDSISDFIVFMRWDLKSFFFMFTSLLTGTGLFALLSRQKISQGRAHIIWHTDLPYYKCRFVHNFR